MLGLNIKFWYVGFRNYIRPLYHPYYDDCNGVIFVIDGIKCFEQLDIIRLELRYLISVKQLLDCPILILANKMDSLDSIPCDDIREMLSEDLKDRTYYIQACSAETGEGLGVGLKWLFDNLKISNIPPWLTALGLEEYEGRNARGPMLK
jgi:ADP-ribosylation factor-like protein 3